MMFKLGLCCYVLSNLFVVIYGATQEDYFNTCRTACNIDLLPKLINLMNSEILPEIEYKSISPYWRTCQHRCYRCFLPNAVIGFRYLSKLFAVQKNKQAGALVDIARVIDIADMDFRLCYQNWEKANSEGNYESTF